jgi:hypothetical protein
MRRTASKARQTPLGISGGLLTESCGATRSRSMGGARPQAPEQSGGSARPLAVTGVKARDGTDQTDVRPHGSAFGKDVAAPTLVGATVVGCLIIASGSSTNRTTWSPAPTAACPVLNAVGVSSQLGTCSTLVTLGTGRPNRKLQPQQGPNRDVARAGAAAAGRS